MSLPRIHIRIGKAPDGIEIDAKEAGQVIVIFVLMLTVLIGMVGIAIDVTYAWRNGLQVQRAADAAAMAGVVYLPGDPTNGEAKAVAVAKINGYATGVVAAPTAGDSRKMDVTITAQVPTFFVRLFGINSWTVSRSARAGFIMPVPMGSPLNYMGVGCFVLKTGTAPPCATAGSGYANSGVTSAGTSGGTALGSLGAWGAIETPGSDELNGDAYAPTNNAGAKLNTGGDNVMYPASSPGPGADGYKGYYYTVTIPTGDTNGTIQIFDPGFCAMGAGTSGNYGAGDHWVGVPPVAAVVSTYYNLFNTNGVPLAGPTGWTYMGVTSGTLFQNEARFDSANDGEPTGTGTACSSTGVAGADNFHNLWWTLDSGLGPGTYEVQVTTTNVNPTTGAIVPETSDSYVAQNMFAIQAFVQTGTAPTVFGYDKMAVYNNLAGGVQQFYIAEVDQVTGSGKTLTIDLFDIGDVQDGSIQILSPDGGAAHSVSFNYTSFNYTSSLTRSSPGNCTGSPTPCSGSGSSIAVSVGGAHPFNNTWIEITIPLTSTYGSTGLYMGGWWQVQYNVNAASDLTTWSVNVNGNPVHLVPIP
jgi:hypothetical protein